MLAKPKSPLPREIFQCLWKKKVFLPKPLKHWLCRPVSRREIVRQTPQTGEVVVQSCVQRSATCVDVCRGLWRIASAPLVTLLRVKFLSRIILFCDLLITMPYLTSSLGQMDFCTITMTIVEEHRKCTLVTLLWGRWPVAAQQKSNGKPSLLLVPTIQSIKLFAFSPDLINIQMRVE